MAHAATGKTGGAKGCQVKLRYFVTEFTEAQTLQRADRRSGWTGTSQAASKCMALVGTPGREAR